MQPIVIDGVAWSVCLSVCNDREPCKTAELIKIPFGCGLVGPRNHALDKVQSPKHEWAILRANWADPRHVWMCPAVDISK